MICDKAMCQPFRLRVRAKCAGARVFVCRGNFVGGSSVKSVACESGMTSLWLSTLAHAVHSLRNYFGRFTASGSACRRSRSRASMCNDMVVFTAGSELSMVV